MDGAVRLKRCCLRSRSLSRRLGYQNIKFNARSSEEMEIKRVGSQPSAKGPSEWFTGRFASIRFFRHPIRPCSRG